MYDAAANNYPPQPPNPNQPGGPGGPGANGGVFYMSVPVPGGGSVLQAVQLVQLPNGQMATIPAQPPAGGVGVGGGGVGVGGPSIDPSQQPNLYPNPHNPTQQVQEAHLPPPNPPQSQNPSHTQSQSQSQFKQGQGQHRHHQQQVLDEHGEPTGEVHDNLSLPTGHHIAGAGLNPGGVIHNDDATPADLAVDNASDSLQNLYGSTRRPALNDLLGNVRRLSKDQVGCRLLQQALDEDGAEAATAIFREGLPFMSDIMTDPFGNYLFQKASERSERAW